MSAFLVLCKSFARYDHKYSSPILNFEKHNHLWTLIFFFFFNFSSCYTFYFFLLLSAIPRSSSMRLSRNNYKQHHCLRPKFDSHYFNVLWNVCG